MAPHRLQALVQFVFYKGQKTIIHRDYDTFLSNKHEMVNHEAIYFKINALALLLMKPADQDPHCFSDTTLIHIDYEFALLVKLEIRLSYVNNP